MPDQQQRLPGNARKRLLRRGKNTTPVKGFIKAGPGTQEYKRIMVTGHITQKKFLETLYPAYSKKE